MLGRRVRAATPHASRHAAGAATPQPTFADLYDKYASLTYALALRMLGDQAEAMDTVEAVFLEFWGMPAASADYRRSMRAGLLALTHRHCLERQKAADGDGPRRDAAAHPGALGAPADAALALDRLDTATVREAASRLPEEEYRALGMAYFDGMSCGQIASALNVPPTEVKERLQKGFLTLGTLLATPPER